MWVSAGDDTTPSGPTVADPEWIGVEFAVPVIINKIVMQPRAESDDKRGFGPKSYTIQTSEDGASWAIQATETDVTRNATITTTLPTPVIAKWVRLHITAGYDIGPSWGTPAYKVWDPPRNTQIRNLHIE
jgi:hypothetical protein